MMDLKKLPNKQAHEKVVLFLRRHWFAPLSIALSFILLIVIPAGLVGYFADKQNWFTHPTLGPLLILAGSMYFLAVWLIASIEFTDYYLDTWIVTNERIINIEQMGLFHRHASELHLANIQDVTADTEGFLHTMFNYGHVFIQTAAEEERFNFRDVPKPDKVKDIILELVEEDKKRHRQN